MKNLLVVLCFISMCLFSHGQDRHVNFTKPTVRTIPSNEFWSFHSIGVDDVVMVYSEASLSVKSLFGVIRNNDPAGSSYYVTDTANTVLMIGRFPVSFPSGLTLYIYPATSAGVDVYIQSD